MFKRVGILKEFGDERLSVLEEVAEKPSLGKYSFSSTWKPDIFCLRIDADEYTTESFAKYYSLFEKIADIPKEYEIIERDVMVCQVIGMARYHEKPVAATRHSANACAMGGASIGLYSAPANILDGTRNAGAWAKDAKSAKKLMEKRLIIESGRYEAFGVCPLKNMK